MPFLLAAALGVTSCGSSSSSAAAGSAASAAHDAAEALAIADRVAVLHSARLAQVATPADVYAEPDDLTVARLTGPVSVLHAPVSGAAADQATIGVGQARATVPCSTAPGADPAGAGRPGPARLGAPGRRGPP